MVIWKAREGIRSTGNSLCDKISDYVPELFFSYKLFLVIYWNAILDKFKFSAQTNWKALFTSYSIVSKAELLRNKKGELVKIKRDLKQIVLYFICSKDGRRQIWLLSICNFCISVFSYFSITVFLYFCSNDGSHQIGCYPIVLPLLSITSSISFPQWLITTIQDAVFEYLLYINHYYRFFCLTSLLSFDLCVFEHLNIWTVCVWTFEHLNFVCLNIWILDLESWLQCPRGGAPGLGLTLKVHQSSSTSREYPRGGDKMVMTIKMMMMMMVIMMFKMMMMKIMTIKI